MTSLSCLLERKRWCETCHLRESSSKASCSTTTDCHWLSSLQQLQLCDAEMWTVSEKVQPMFTYLRRHTHYTHMEDRIDQYVEPAAVDHCQFSFLRPATIATLRLFTLFLTPQFHNTAVIHILFQGCNKCLKPKKRISAKISRNMIASKNICSAKTPHWDIAQSSARAGHRGKLVIKLYPFELSCVPDVCPR